MLSALLAACKPGVPDLGPPAEYGADTSVVTRALDTLSYQWRRIEKPRATLYVAATVPDRAMKQYADSVEEIISSHLTWLGAGDTTLKLRLYFVSSRDELEPITGSRAPGWSEPGSGSAYFVLTDSVKFGLRHETMHLLSWQVWGVPSSFWISEGIASASVSACGGLSVGAVVAMLDRAGMLIPLETIRTKFNFSGDTGFVFYLQSADLLQYIERTYGRDKLRAVWSNGGLGNARAILGVDRTTLERNWRAAVAGTPAPAWPGWEVWRTRLNALGCT